MKASGHASGAAVQGSILAFSFLFYIVCALRLYTRFYIVRQPWWDDAAIALSVVFVSSTNDDFRVRANVYRTS